MDAMIVGHLAGNATRTTAFLEKHSDRFRSLPRENPTVVLHMWLGEHIDNPVPTKAETMMLAIVTKMTLNQVEAWFYYALKRMQKDGLGGADNHFTRYIAGNAGEPNAPENLHHRDPASNDVTAPLKKWLCKHIDSPWPTTAEKMRLAIITKMTLNEVTTWFDQARSRMQEQRKNGIVCAKEDAKIRSNI